jgi:transcriptional regulator with XRE-family HTH domain
MDTKSQITIRTKKLGVLIRDARLTARRSVQECAEALDIRKSVFRAYEEGLRAPSLPELETLVFYLDLPMDHFWGKQTRSETPERHTKLNLSKLLPLRQRKIGALLRQERMKASVSIRNLGHETGIASSRIKAYELGERPIPLPELEILVVKQFLEMPVALREFVAMPVNRPYLELAMKLSNMSKDKLRSVAEDLLDITL